jgi:hypothetical protein
VVDLKWGGEKGETDLGSVGERVPADQLRNRSHRPACIHPASTRPDSRQAGV